MANEVFTHLKIKCNEEAQRLIVDPWHKKIEEMRKDSDTMVWKLYDDEYTAEEIDHDWWMDQVGSKWCYVEDSDKYVDSENNIHNSISLVSAWVWPELLVESMAGELRYYDPTASITVVYNDEGYDFAGFYVYGGEGFSDCGEELDYDALKDLALAANPELEEQLSELEEYSDEYYDLLRDDIWEVANSWQWDNINASN